MDAMELGPHDANHGVGLVIEPYRFPQNTPLATIDALPQAVAQDDDAIVTGLIVAGAQRATESGLHLEQIEIVRRHHVSQWDERLVDRRHSQAGIEERRELRERRVGLPPIHEIARRDRHAIRTASRRRVFPEHDDAIGITIRKTFEDDAIDQFIYETIARTGRPPSHEAMAEHRGFTRDEVDAALVKLEEHHALVLAPTTRNLWMAHPFSAVPTPFAALSDNTTYWANCAWDVMAIPPLLELDARWCERQHVELGATVPLATGWQLGQLWYRDRLDENWQPKTVETIRSIFATVGLTGDFWTVG